MGRPSQPIQKVLPVSLRVFRWNGVPVLWNKQDARASGAEWVPDGPGQADVTQVGARQPGRTGMEKLLGTHHSFERDGRKHHLPLPSAT